jgi:hypothetical protein
MMIQKEDAKGKNEELITTLIEIQFFDFLILFFLYFCLILYH